MSDAPAPHLQELHPFLGLEWHMSENVCDGQERDLGGLCHTQAQASLLWERFLLSNQHLKLLPEDCKCSIQTCKNIAHILLLIAIISIIGLHLFVIVIIHYTWIWEEEKCNFYEAEDSGKDWTVPPTFHASERRTRTDARNHKFSEWRPVTWRSSGV